MNLKRSIISLGRALSRQPHLVLFAAVPLALISCSNSSSTDSNPVDTVVNDDIDPSETTDPDVPEILNPMVNGYEFIKDGNGAVDSIVDLEDSTGINIVQTVPVANSPTASTTDTPITLFFNDKVLLGSLFDSFLVMQNETQVEGTVTISESASGFAILTFVPLEPYANGATVNLSIKGGETGLLDDGGNQLISDTGEDFGLTITTIEQVTQSFDTNLSFESGNGDGVIFSGDGAVQTSALGCLAATEGNNFAAISTGDALVSDGSAIGETSSTMQLGPISISDNVDTIVFDYNFASAEFNDYVGSEFDDSSVFSVTGPNGSFTEVLTTVNMVGVEGNTACEGIDRFTDTGFDDSFAGHTGWISLSVNGISNIGSPITINFTVTDVSDEIVHSILAIDNIRF